MICRSLEIFGVTGFLFSLWLHEGEYPDDFPADSDHDARNVEDEPVFDKFFAFLADFVCRYAVHSLNELEGRAETLCLRSVTDEQGRSGRGQSDAWTPDIEDCASVVPDNGRLEGIDSLS